MIPAMMKKAAPKDLKRSVRDKYVRRLQVLAHAVEQFEYAAADRIQHGGKIRDRNEIDALLHTLKSVKPHLPKPQELDERVIRQLCEVFNMEYVPSTRA
jgi:hypothetical protein